MTLGLWMSGPRVLTGLDASLGGVECHLESTFHSPAETGALGDPDLQRASRTHLRRGESMPWKASMRRWVAHAVLSARDSSPRQLEGWHRMSP